MGNLSVSVRCYGFRFVRLLRGFRWNVVKWQPRAFYR
jgi:hypothetical protein